MAEHKTEGGALTGPRAKKLGSWILLGLLLVGAGMVGSYFTSRTYAPDNKPAAETAKAPEKELTPVEKELAMLREQNAKLEAEKAAAAKAQAEQQTHGPQAGDGGGSVDDNLASALEAKAASLFGDPRNLPGYKGFVQTDPRRKGERIPDPAGATNCKMVRSKHVRLPNGQTGTFWHKHCD